jgi:hypothetical protein
MLVQFSVGSLDIAAILKALLPDELKVTVTQTAWATPPSIASAAPSPKLRDRAPLLGQILLAMAIAPALSVEALTPAVSSVRTPPVSAYD